MSDSAELGIGIIGLGFIGRIHAAAYQRTGAARLVGVCGAPGETPNLAATAGSANLRPEHDVDWGSVQVFDDAERLLGDPRIAAVSICTPTDTHVELARAALAAGKHVLVEKPVALQSSAVRELLAAAAGRPELRIMPAHCMRYWPGWDWLRQRIAESTFGLVRSAVFQRLGSRPTWSAFYADNARCGGALADLHLHDADFVYWCFGAPRRVFSHGSLDHVTTAYTFDAGPPHVLAEAGWDHAGGWPFRMRFVVAFEAATVEFDSTRAEPLRLSHGGRTETVSIPAGFGYQPQIEAFVAWITRGQPPRVSLADALAVTRLLECERQSLESGVPVQLPH